MSAQNHNSHDVGAGHFGSLLKHWRNVRRLTQIELAGDANVSARHLCFLETSRAQPSREMVQLLGSALDLPLGERNALHVAAGFMPPYGDQGLAADNLQHVRQALDFILRQQEPYPGIAIDGRWDVRIRNQASGPRRTRCDRHDDVHRYVSVRERGVEMRSSPAHAGCSRTPARRRYDHQRLYRRQTPAAGFEELRRR
jgi:transcriptional regulator with XRE-family HTH domain